MVIRRSVLLIAAMLVVPAAAQDGRPDEERAVEEVRHALAAQHFPWYDAEADDIRAIIPPKPPKPSPPVNRTGGSNWSRFPSLSIEEFGRLFIFIVLAGALAALIVFAARSWQRQVDASRPPPPKPKPLSRGGASRVDHLPTGLMVDDDDPLAAARRYRDRGELDRAVVALFAHQLLTLDRLGLIRLAPGRTGRQLVRSIGDGEIRRPAERTLRLFEDVYYGHRPPDPGAVASLWAEAEALERRLAAGAVS